MDKKTPNNLSRMFIYLINKLWLLLASLIILTALTFSLLKLFLPQINYFKNDIESWIENHYQVEIELTSIDAWWAEKGPVFSVKDFQLKSKDGRLNLFSVDSFSMHMNGLNSLLNRTLVTERIDILGAKLNFVLDRKLAVRFDPADNKSLQTSQLEVEDSSKMLLDILFAQKHLTLSDSNIHLETLSGKEFNYRIGDFIIRNFDDVHQLSGGLTDEFEGQFNLVAEMHGEPSRPSSYTHLYLEGQGITLANLPLFNKMTHLKPDSGELNWRLWADWKNNRWQSAVGDLEIDSVQWTESVEQKKIVIADIENFSSKFNWNFSQKDNGVFSLHQAILKQKDNDVEIPEIYFVLNQAENFDLTWDLISHDFKLSSLTHYLDLILNTQSSDYQLFRQSGLDVTLEQLGIRFLKKAGVWHLPKIISRFTELRYNNLMQLPTANGLSGMVSYSYGEGQAQLSGQNIELSFNQLFRKPIKANSVAVSLNWTSKNNQPLDLVVDKLNIRNQDLSLNAKSRLFFQDDKAVLSLYAELVDVDASKKSLYLPTGVMSDSLTNYLDVAVKDGRFSIIKAILHGPLESFPFDNQEGLFSILGYLEDAEYQYLPDWPTAKKLNVELLFEGNSMDLNASNGFSKNNSVKNARAVVEDFSIKNPQLKLSLDVLSKDNSGRNFLLDTPLKSIGESLDIMDFSGDLRSKVELIVGLDDSSGIRIQGQVIPNKDNARLNIVGMSLNDVSGKLFFNQDGVTKSNLAASYHELPINAQIIGGKNKSQADLLIKVDGKLSASAIQDFVGVAWQPFVKGQSEFETFIQVGLPDNRDLTQIDFLSDLVGMQFDLPGNLFKPSANQRPFKLNLALADTKVATINWQDFDAQWRWLDNNDSVEVQAGVFYYNKKKALPKLINSEFIIDADFQYVKFNEWSKLIEAGISDYESGLDSNSGVIKAEIDINLNIKKIDEEAIVLNDIKLQGSKLKNQSWTFSAQNEKFVGNLRLIENAPWQLDFEQLDFGLKSEFMNPLKVVAIDEVKAEGPAEKLPSQNEDYWATPSHWPPIDLHCRQCTLFGHDLGEIKANLTTHSTVNLTTKTDQLNLNGVIVSAKRHNAKFKLNWSQWTTFSAGSGGQKETKNLDTITDQTNLSFDLQSSNFGRLMKEWQYPIGVEESSSHIVSHISWLNKPWQTDPLKINGDARFSFGKGYLSDVSDAQARAFSLLNIQSLGRRLQLDFKDIYKKGFFYDKLNGDVRLRDGMVSTDNIYIDGNAAKVTLSGSVDLNLETIEQTALVVPQLTSSLPVLVGWAVEPTTGILVYLINKLMEPAIDVVTQIEYRIHGPLDAIEVDEISKKNKKFKVEYIDKEETLDDSPSEIVPVSNQEDNIEPIVIEITENTTAFKNL